MLSKIPPTPPKRPRYLLRSILSYQRIGIIALSIFLSNMACREFVAELQQETQQRMGPQRLTDEQVRRYIRAYRRLKQHGRHELLAFQSRPNDLAHQRKAFQRIEKQLQADGFTDYAAFVRIHAKIAWAWSNYRAQQGLRTQSALQHKAQSDLDQGIHEIEQALANPQVPADTKRELRQTLRELKRNKQTLRSLHNKNAKWARFAMDITTPLSNSEDMATIARHEQELLQVFTGLSPQQLQHIHHTSNALLAADPK